MAGVSAAKRRSIYEVHHKELAAIVRGEISDGVDLTQTLGEVLKRARPDNGVGRVDPDRGGTSTESEEEDEEVHQLVRDGTYPCEVPGCDEVLDTPWEKGVHVKVEHPVTREELIHQVLAWLRARGGRGRRLDMIADLLPGRARKPVPKVLQTTLARLEAAEIVRQEKGGENKQAKFVVLLETSAGREKEAEPDESKRGANLLDHLRAAAEAFLGVPVRGIRVSLDLGEAVQDADAEVLEISN